MTLRCVAWALAGALAAACGGPQREVLELNGTALGTSWTVVAVTSESPVRAQDLRTRIEAALDEVDRAASNWRDDSELSAILNLPTGERHELSPLLAEILDDARYVHQVSGGAFDPTVGPLVELWGFGPEMRAEFPQQSDVDAARARVDLSAFEVSSGSLQRLRDDVLLDLSAVAKGSAVDRVAESLLDLGLADFLVEVGGEIVVRGARPSGGAWRVGVDDPRADGPARVPFGRFEVEDVAVATSGDYRNWRAHEGRRYGHILDPRTGWPTEHDLRSVTVIAPTCALADALATASMVLGPEHGLALLERLEGIEGLLLVDRAGHLEVSSTSGMSTLELLQTDEPATAAR